MRLSRHESPGGPRWAANDVYLDENFDLCSLLSIPGSEIPAILKRALSNDDAPGALLAPIEPMQEVWASGVTYQRSREARRAESDMGDVYDRVYEAVRPELFFKSVGWRVRAHEDRVRIRVDSAWNVPEPELTLVINCYGEVIGYTAGNDMSSRSIEGENPLYLPQAKIYNGSCSLGAGIQLLGVESMSDLPVSIFIERSGQVIFTGKTTTSSMHRRLEELVEFLFKELSFPNGVFLMTGTGIVPPDHLTLEQGDRISITVGNVRLVNEVGTKEMG